METDWKRVGNCIELANVTGNYFPQFPNSFHMYAKYNLNRVRSGFDKAVVDKKLKGQTSNKYRNWIRKFLLFNNKNSFNINEIESFLNSIQSLHQRKQAYFSLKFLFDNVLKIKYPKHLSKFPSMNKASNYKGITLTGKLYSLINKLIGFLSSS